MKALLYLIIAALLTFMFYGCGSVYYLHRAQANLDHAKRLGVNIDSFKTVIHDTIKIKEFTQSEQASAKIDTAALYKWCRELVAINPGSLANVKIGNTVIVRGQEGVIKSGLIPIGPYIRGAQKAICPNDSVSKDFDIDITVGEHKYKIPIHLEAWSSGGKAGYYFETPASKFEYEKEEIKTGISPGKEQPAFKWFHGAIGVFLLVIGFVIGWRLK